MRWTEVTIGLLELVTFVKTDAPGLGNVGKSIVVLLFENLSRIRTTPASPGIAVLGSLQSDQKEKTDTADKRSHCEAIIARSMRLPDLSVSFQQTYTSSLAQSLNSNFNFSLKSYENSPSNH